MIKINQLNHSFFVGKKNDKREIKVLKDISLEIPDGEIVSIIGRSGSGKSTLIHIMAGFINAISGEVIINDISLNTLNEKQKSVFRLDHLGFIFQNFQLLPGQNVRQNVELPLILKGISKKERFEKVTKILEKVGLLDYQDHYPNELSGGQQQRVSIARALITESKIIFADEPTGSLDTHTENEILSLIKDLNKDLGITFVIITHDSEVANIAHKIYTISDGALIKEDNHEN